MSIQSGSKYVAEGYVDSDYVAAAGTSYVLTYTMYGLPTRVFPFPPNWANPVNEEIEWKTEVLRSRNGTEQRRQLREVPRRAFEYSIMLRDEFVAMFESLLWKWQNRFVAVPVWGDRTNLTADLLTDDAEVLVNTTGIGFGAGHYAIIYQDPKTFEVVEVSGVLSDRLTLVDPITSDWASGTRIYPLVVGHMRTSVPTTRHTGSVLTATSVRFQCSGENTDPGIPGGAAGTVYDGYEVITHRPNWREAINNEFSRAFDIVDTGIGPIGYYQTETTSRIVRPMLWFLKTRADVSSFRAIMGRLSGQAKTCWIPSWHDDFEIAGSNAADQSTLVVKGVWFSAFVGTDSSRDRIMVTLPNGTVMYRRVVSTAPNFSNDTTILRLDSTLGTTVSVADNTRVRLLLRCRLATDKVVIPWRTDTFAEPQTTFTTVKL